MRLNRRQQFTRWLQGAPGQLLIDIESQSMRSCWETIRGDSLVVLGDVVQKPLLETSGLKNRVIITPDQDRLEKGISMICADYDALPILPDSIDAMLLPHTLDFSEDPYEVLREVDVSLRPDGYLIIIGFNPWSLWGLRQVFCRHEAPWNGSYRSVSRIKDWLKVLNFETVQQIKTYYRLPFFHHWNSSELSMVEGIYKQCFPYWGAVYILVARKRTFGVTPLRAKWMQISSMVPHGIMEPARRGTC